MSYATLKHGTATHVTGRDEYPDPYRWSATEEAIIEARRGVVRPGGIRNA
ncbi:MAG TPA: hypothetical protein VK701_06710 [Solirubrobacteraceae bacterium]|nr:hypothetical protein [Solirubrobacteraceae bacterium]